MPTLLLLFFAINCLPLQAQEKAAVPDAEGMATFSFFTSETKGEFTIVAQGLDINTLIPMMGKGSLK